MRKDACSFRFACFIQSREFRRWTNIKLSHPRLRIYTGTIQSLCRCETSVSDRAREKKCAVEWQIKGASHPISVEKPRHRFSTRFLYSSISLLAFWHRRFICSILVGALYRINVFRETKKSVQSCYGFSFFTKQNMPQDSRHFIRYDIERIWYHNKENLQLLSIIVFTKSTIGGLHTLVIER